jgi:hypothetical protein
MGMAILFHFLRIECLQMKVKPYFFITFSEVEVFTMSSFPAPVYPGDGPVGFSQALRQPPKWHL